MIGLSKPLKIRQIKCTNVEGLGELIRAARIKFTQESGRSLESICEEAGIKRSYWYSVENEEVGPKGAVHLKTISKIERVLNINFGISEADLVEE